MNQQRILIVLIGVLLSAVFADNVRGQGKLAQVQKSVRKHEPASTSKPAKKKKKRRKTSFTDALISAAISAPTRKEVHVVHHHVDAVAPAQDLPPASLAIEDAALAGDPIQIDDSIGRGDWLNWSVRYSAIGGTDFDDIGLGAFSLLLQFPHGPGIDASINVLHESGTNFSDTLVLGDVNLVFEKITTHWLRLRFGFGLNWLGDSFGGETGFNLTGGFDCKLGQRWTLTGEIDLGTIGDTGLLHTQISLGRKINESLEWTLGHDFNNIGGTSIGNAFTGLRFRY